MTTARSLLLGGIAALSLGAAAPALADQVYSQPHDVYAAPPDADAGFRFPDGSTLLMWAVYDGEAEKAAGLIAAGADVNASNKYGSNAMQLAAEQGDAGMLKLLLDAGADVDSPNPEGQTALMLVARTGNVEAAKLLVEHGATIDARERWGEQTALMWASARRHPEMVEYLASQGADLNARSKWRDYQRHLTAESRAKNMDTGGLTPLLYATRENCIACVKVLIAHGADVNLTDPDRVSPLLLSILNSNWDVSKLLLEAGADVSQWDIYGQAPLFAIVSHRNETDRTSIDPLNVATGTEIFDALLAKGADVNMQLFTRPAKQRGAGGRGATPLHAAAAAGDLYAVEQLLAHGADAKLVTSDNQTTLMFASQGRGGGFGGGGSFGRGGGDAGKIIKALYDAGADVNANALYHHLQRTRGGTALHYAVRSGSPQVVDAILALPGVDLDAKDPDGLTALDYADAHGYIPFLQMRQPPRKDLVEKLKKAGATVELPEEPYWPPVGPPIGYEATIWPLAVDHPSKTYEDLQPTQWVVDAFNARKYTGTPQASLDAPAGKTP